MAGKIDAEVVIGGKVYTLSGYESEEYLQKVASYLNAKLSELESDEGYKRLPADLQSVLMQINLADDYFKLQKQVSLLKEQSRAKEKDLYDIKHELVSAQIKLEKSEKSLKQALEDNNENARKLIRLETELQSLKGGSKTE
ncbi:MAG: cell division protein ZapA [Lachnospiraceae bacterium]|nr:cell division protein ZapA [Lachnospiraceae bacterium]